MSTFKIEGAKIIEGLFPEFNWEELDLAKYQQVFEKLMSIEPLRSEVGLPQKQQNQNWISQAIQEWRRLDPAPEHHYLPG